MNTSNLVITAVVGMIAIGLFALAIQLLSKKINYENEGKLKTAFAVWLGFNLASFVVFLSSSLKATSNAIEVIAGGNKEESTLLIIEKIALFTGFAFITYAIIYFLTQFVTALILGKRNNSIEIERENYSYFLIKGMVLLAFTFSLWSVFENLLRIFSPVVDTPFYH